MILRGLVTSVVVGTAFHWAATPPTMIKRRAVELKELGAEAPKLRVRESPIRGLEAREPLQRGEVAIRIDRGLAIEVTDGDRRQSQRTKRIAPDVWRKLDWEAKLAAEVLGSENEKWLACLPRSYEELPVFWTANKLRKIQYAPIEDAVKEQKKQWQKIAGSLASAFDVSENRAMWALATVRTRSFSGPLEATGGGRQRLFLVAFAAWLAVGYVGLGLGSVEQALGGFAVAVLGSLVADFLISSGLLTDNISDEDSRHVIAPGIDLANHNSRNADEVALAYFTDAIALTAATDLKPGTELCTSYGKKSNAQLLVNYGFIESNNPYDDFVFPLTDDDDVIPSLLRGQRVTRSGFPETVAAAALTACNGDNAKAATLLAGACDAMATTLEAKSSSDDVISGLHAEHATLLRDLATITRRQGNPSL